MGCVSSLQKKGSMMKSNNRSNTFPTTNSAIPDDQLGYETHQESRIVKRRSSLIGSSNSAITDVTVKDKNSPAPKSQTMNDQNEYTVKITKAHQSYQQLHSPRNPEEMYTPRTQETKSFQPDYPSHIKVDLYEKQQPLPTVMEQSMEYIQSALIKNSSFLNSKVNKTIPDKTKQNQSNVFLAPQRSSFISRQAFGLM